jgi:predicted transcriptional regulator
MHGEGTGHQPTSITDADAEQDYGMILQNRWVTVDEVAHQLQIIRGSAYEIIHNRLPFHKVCA